MATVTIDKLTADDLESLTAWLRDREEHNRVYGRDDEPVDAREATRLKERLKSAHQDINEWEKEADKLREAVSELISQVMTQAERMIVPAEVDTILRAAAAETTKAVTAYDNSALKLPF